ncbi:MAG: VOC family protein [Solirubrobacteraceae bacterium]
MTTLQGLAAVMIPVADQQKALDFYVDTLGFELRRDVPFGDGERWAEVGVPGADTTLAPMTQRGEDWKAGVNTGISIASSDVHGLHAQLRDAGVDVDAEVMSVPGPPPDMFWFRDPDGNSLLIVEAMPGA